MALNEKNVQIPLLCQYVLEVQNNVDMHGPMQQAGPACAGCGQPTGRVRYTRNDTVYCCYACVDEVVLREEHNKLYEDLPLQQMNYIGAGNVVLWYSINRALWSIAFRPLWEQNVFDFNYEDFENDVFVVRRCRYEACKCVGKCNCEDLPNFIYKPTGLEMRWYKYPLRDAIVNQRLTNFGVICEMVQHCISSLKSNSSGV